MFQTYTDEGTLIFQRQYKPGSNYHHGNNPPPPRSHENSSASRLGDPRYGAMSSPQYMHQSNKVTSSPENLRYHPYPSARVSPTGAINSTEFHARHPSWADNAKILPPVKPSPLENDSTYHPYASDGAKILHSTRTSSSENSPSYHPYSSDSAQITCFTRKSSFENINKHPSQPNNAKILPPVKPRPSEKDSTYHPYASDSAKILHSTRTSSSENSPSYHQYSSDSAQITHFSRTSSFENYNKHPPQPNNESILPCGTSSVQINTLQRKNPENNLPVVENRFAHLRIPREMLVRTDKGFLDFLNKNSHLVLKKAQEIGRIRRTQCKEKVAQISEHTETGMSETDVYNYLSEFTSRSSCEPLDTNSLEEQHKQSLSCSTESHSYPNKVADSVVNTQTQSREDLSNKSLSHAGDQDSFHSARIHAPLISEASKEVHLNDTPETFSIAGSKGAPERFQLHTVSDSSALPENAVVSKMNVNKSALSSSSIMDSNLKRRCRRYLASGKCPKTDCKYLHVYPKKDNVLCRYFLQGYCKLSSSDCKYKHGDVREEQILNDSGSTCTKSSSELKEPADINHKISFQDSLNIYSLEEQHKQSLSSSNQSQSYPSKEVDSVIIIQTHSREELSTKSLSYAEDQDSFHSAKIHAPSLISEASKEVHSNDILETLSIVGSKGVTERSLSHTECEMNASKSATTSSNIIDSNSKHRCRRYLAAGKCPKIDCKYLHVYPKEDNILCRHFLKGYCKHSSSACLYKHGDVRGEEIMNDSASTCRKSSSKLEEPVETNNEPTVFNSVGKLLDQLKKPNFQTALKQDKENYKLEHIPQNISPYRTGKIKEKPSPLKGSTYCIDMKSSSTSVPRNHENEECIESDERNFSEASLFKENVISNMYNGPNDKMKEPCDTENLNFIHAKDGYATQSKMKRVGNDYPTKTDSKQGLLLENEKILMKRSPEKQSSAKTVAGECNKASAAVSEKQTVSGSNKIYISDHSQVIDMTFNNKKLMGKSKTSDSSSSALSKEQMCDEGNKGKRDLGNKKEKKEKPEKSLENMKEQPVTKKVDTATRVNCNKLARAMISKNLEDGNLNKMNNTKSKENCKSDESQLTETKVVEKRHSDNDISHDFEKRTVKYGSVENLKQKEKSHKRRLESNEKDSVKKVKSTAKENGISVEQNIALQSSSYNEISQDFGKMAAKYGAVENLKQKEKSHKRRLESNVKDSVKKVKSTAKENGSVEQNTAPQSRHSDNEISHDSAKMTVKYGAVENLKKKEKSHKRRLESNEKGSVKKVKSIGKENGIILEKNTVLQTSLEHIAASIYKKNEQHNRDREESTSEKKSKLSENSVMKVKVSNHSSCKSKNHKSSKKTDVDISRVKSKEKRKQRSESKEEKLVKKSKHNIDDSGITTKKIISAGTTQESLLLESNEKGSVKKVKSIAKENGISVEQNTVLQTSSEHIAAGISKKSEQHKSNSAESTSEKRIKQSENSVIKVKDSNHSSYKSKRHKSSKKTDVDISRVKSKENRKRRSDGKEERLAKKSKHYIDDTEITTKNNISAGTSQDSLLLDLSNCHRIDSTSKQGETNPFKEIGIKDSLALQNSSTSHSMCAGSRFSESVANVVQENVSGTSEEFKEVKFYESSLDKCKFTDPYGKPSPINDGIPGNVMIKGNYLDQHAMKEIDIPGIKKEPDDCDFIKKEEEIEDTPILPSCSNTSVDELLKITRIICTSNSDYDKLCDELHQLWCSGYPKVEPFTSGSPNKFIILEANIRVLSTCICRDEIEGLHVRNNILSHWEMEPDLQAYIDRIK